MEYLMQFVHALVSPVNCVGNLGVDVMHTVGTFVSCVGHNLGPVSNVTDAASNGINVVANYAGGVVDTVAPCVNC